MTVVVAMVAPAGGFIFIFVFDGGGRQRLAVSVGFQRNWWVSEKGRDRRTKSITFCKV